MAGITQGDVFIRTAIELGMQDIRQNPWLIDHIFSDLVTNPYVNKQYGDKQVNAAKEWFLNNKIDIILRPRNDKDQMPFVSITVADSKEKPEMRHMADQSIEKIAFLPQEINKPIPYIIKPFVPTSYDSANGIVGIPNNLQGIESVSAGMILVDPTIGVGFVIKDVTAEGIIIDPGLNIDATTLGVVPQYQFYEARVEHSFFQETYHIGCYAHGDVQSLIWLHSIVLYSLMRYRESLLEANGFAETTLTNSGIAEDDYYSGPDGEQAFYRNIKLDAQVENSWIKSPRRFIESVNLKQTLPSGDYYGGIRILSNSEPPAFVNRKEEVWWPDDSNEPDDEL